MADSTDDVTIDLLDPDRPDSTYALEPEVVAPLLARLATSQAVGSHRTVAPFTGAPLVAVPLSSEDDVQAAVTRARDAQEGWAARPLAARADVLLRFHDIVLARQSEVLDLVQLENGKARASAFEEVMDVAQTARHYAVRGERYLRERRVPGMLPLLTSTRVVRHPVGVVGVIAPWNYPLTLTASDLVPSLLAGNAVVVKPDLQTPLTMLWVAEALEEAGLPAGVVEVVYGGPEIGRTLTGSVDHVLFTGSTSVGRQVAAQAGERLIGATLELGGKNPLYVAADADVRSAAVGVARACFANTGQLCMSIERLVLHEDVADAFLDEFVPLVRELTIGAGLDYRHQVGTLTSAAQLARVQAHVDDAIARGAVVLAGGVHRADLGPFFYAPTVLDGVPDDALCAREETFGPVVSVRRVASDDEAVDVMNDTEFGLNASVWSTDLVRARGIARRVRAGTVNVNDGYTAAWGSVGAPLGGFKASGLGRRHGREGIEAVTEVQTVAVQRGVDRGVSLDVLYERPGEQWTALMTRTFQLMRRLRLP
ncbi:succinic semialdehyde dehydrogenase [Luteimicrobium subarcticum]|uniref:Succinate-semialdehyde dehydrogenase/glutarate-semialdehyde dehydrogenase n=1 Tax=Luteimicrobium subarcticum TaxID=620910 RepID=A0A2M8WVB2_9MICO|nr:succinic semialdehyde dehydrogenase [Luteimicrobium subarcticum]PJI94860.1 succinate-semialdehyde dehydrogenase/glutarate-semialdehyde dehydrogenase [Luteimicrobium subarcticum]